MPPDEAWLRARGQAGKIAELREQLDSLGDRIDGTLEAKRVGLKGPLITFAIVCAPALLFVVINLLLR